MAIKSFPCTRDMHNVCVANYCTCQCHKGNQTMEKPSWYTIVYNIGNSNFAHYSNWTSLAEAKDQAETLKKAWPSRRIFILGVIAEIVEVSQPKYEMKLLS